MKIELKIEDASGGEFCAGVVNDAEQIEILKEAIDNGCVNIEELEEKGISYYDLDNQIVCANGIDIEDGSGRINVYVNDSFLEEKNLNEIGDYWSESEKEILFDEIREENEDALIYCVAKKTKNIAANIEEFELNNEEFDIKRLVFLTDCMSAIFGEYYIAHSAIYFSDELLNKFYPMLLEKLGKIDDEEYTDVNVYEKIENIRDEIDYLNDGEIKTFLTNFLRDNSLYIEEEFSESSGEEIIYIYNAEGELLYKNY